MSHAEPDDLSLLRRCLDISSEHLSFALDKVEFFACTPAVLVDAATKAKIAANLSSQIAAALLEKAAAISEVSTASH